MNHVRCDKHEGFALCTESHKRGFKLIELASEKGLINLATWIMSNGTSNQVAFVKGQLNGL